MASVPRNLRTAAREDAYRHGHAIAPASKGGAPGFPVTSGEQWEKARRAIGRVKDAQRRAQVAKLLRKTAPQFGKTQALKQSWAAPKGASMANGSYGLDFASGPRPYHRMPDETVHCPNCGRYDAPDARFCDQCGHKLPPSAYADLSNGYDFAVRARDEQGFMLTCPECNYSGPANRFGADGASLEKSPPVLRTPAPGTGYARTGAAVTVRGGKAAHALANANTGVELATATAKRVPVSGPYDVGVRRGDKGSVLYHRRSGAEIATMRKNDDGTWTAVVAGKDLAPHAQQRAALMEAVGTYNAAVHAGVKRAEAPLQPPPQQTELMREYGIPAMRSAAFATPATSASSGPRMTTAGGKGSKDDPDHDGDNDYSIKGDTDHDYAGALGPKGRSAYRKLLKRGMPPKRALALARHADSMTARAA